MVSLCCFLLAQAADAPWQRLAPAQRARYFGAMLLLTLGGISLVMLAWLALRMGRRMSRRENAVLEHRRNRALDDDWVGRSRTRSSGTDRESE